MSSTTSAFSNPRVVVILKEKIYMFLYVQPVKLLKYEPQEQEYFLGVNTQLCSRISPVSELRYNSCQFSRELYMVLGIKPG